MFMSSFMLSLSFFSFLSEKPLLPKWNVQMGACTNQGRKWYNEDRIAMVTSESSFEKDESEKDAVVDSNIVGENSIFQRKSSINTLKQDRPEFKFAFAGVFDGHGEYGQIDSDNKKVFARLRDFQDFFKNGLEKAFDKEIASQVVANMLYVALLQFYQPFASRATRLALYSKSILYRTSYTTEAIKAAFEEVNDVFLSKTLNELFGSPKPPRGGSTAVICFARLDANKVYIANAGDSSAIDAQGKKITADHLASNEAEKKRVGSKNITKEKDGPFRLGGKNMTTRGFGDFDLKDNGLIVEPAVRVFDIDQLPVDEQGNQFIILTSDGVTDYLKDPKEIADIVSQGLEHSFSLDKIAESIIMNSLFVARESWNDGDVIEAEVLSSDAGKYEIKKEQQVFKAADFGKAFSSNSNRSEAIKKYRGLSHDNQAVSIILFKKDEAEPPK